MCRFAGPFGRGRTAKNTATAAASPRSEWLQRVPAAEAGRRGHAEALQGRGVRHMEVERKPQVRRESRMTPPRAFVAIGSKTSGIVDFWMIYMVLLDSQRQFYVDPLMLVISGRFPIFGQICTHSSPRSLISGRHTVAVVGKLPHCTSSFLLPHFN